MGFDMMSDMKYKLDYFILRQKMQFNDNDI